RFPEQLPWGCGSDWDSGRERGPLTITLTPVWGTPPDSPQHPLCARLGGGTAGERGSQQHCCHLWAEAVGLLPASVSHRSLCPGRAWSPGPSAPPPAAGIASAQSWRDPGAQEAEWGEEDVAGLGTAWAKVQRWDLAGCLGGWETGRPTDFGLHDPPPPVPTTVELSIGSIRGSRGLTLLEASASPALSGSGVRAEVGGVGKPVPAPSFRLPDQLARPAANPGPTLPKVLGGDPFPKSFLRLGLGTQKALGPSLGGAQGPGGSSSWPL
ncbi:hypothetical protein E2I00_001911, partial [Balaenoptera physalus]